jgi:hypothetical protein
MKVMLTLYQIAFLSDVKKQLSVPFRNAIFRGIIARERCCFPQLLKVVHSVSDSCIFAPLRKAIQYSSEGAYLLDSHRFWTQIESIKIAGNKEKVSCQLRERLAMKDRTEVYLFAKIERTWATLGPTPRCLYTLPSSLTGKKMM